VEGKFRPGDPLPPERTLAERFCVTRNTVREALRMLEQARLVSIRQGSGARVKDYLANAGLEFLAVLLDSKGQKAVLADIYEARAVLGEAMCHHAVTRLHKDSIESLNEAVRALEEEAARNRPDVRALQKLDFMVQNRLVHAGSNRAFILLHNSLGHVYARIAHLFEHLVADPSKLAAQYRKAITALARGDRAGAKRALSAVFRSGRVERPKKTGRRG
jgi:GntR family transcriptional repressor for pyruvate dehydrogenase complex